jgi:hypothetical protein
MWRPIFDVVDVVVSFTGSFQKKRWWNVREVGEKPTLPSNCKRGFCGCTKPLLRKEWEGATDSL